MMVGWDFDITSPRRALKFDVEIGVAKLGTGLLPTQERGVVDGSLLPAVAPNRTSNSLTPSFQYLVSLGNGRFTSRDFKYPHHRIFDSINSTLTFSCR
jgi:hypothetical protein